MTTEIAAFIPKLSEEEIGALLASDPMGSDALVKMDRHEARWFLFDLFLARPAWFRAAVEGKAAAGQQLALL